MPYKGSPEEVAREIAELQRQFKEFGRVYFNPGTEQAIAWQEKSGVPSIGHHTIESAIQMYREAAQAPPPPPSPTKLGEALAKWGALERGENITPIHDMPQLNPAERAFVYGPQKSYGNQYKGARNPERDGFAAFMARRAEIAGREEIEEEAKEQAEARAPHTQIAERAQKGVQKSQKQAQQEAARWENLTPAQREQENYNRQLANYSEQQQRYEHQNHAQAINQNRQIQRQAGFNGNVPVPQPVLNELISMMNSQPTRYVPIRNRPSINDRVMNSFGQNMFSPEFMAEEE